MIARSPSLLVPVVVSGAVHVALVLLLFGVRLHWPSPPLPIEILRTSSTPKIPTAPTAQNPPATRQPGAGPRPRHTPSPAPQKPAPPVESLSGWAPNDSVVVVYLRMAPLRTSLYADATELLLSGLPDYQTLLGGSALSAVRDFDALFIATSDPTDVRATFLLAQFKDAARIAPLLSHPLDPEDPREIHLLEPGLAGLGPTDVWRPPAPIDGGGVPHVSDAGVTDGVAERWAAAFHAVDEHASADAALYVTIAGGSRMVRLPNGLPTPDEADLVLTPERAPAVRIRARFANEKEAAAFAAFWPQMLESWRRAVGLLGLAPMLDGLVLSQTGAQLEWVGHIDAGQMGLAVNYAKLFLPRPPQPTTRKPQ